MSYRPRMSDSNANSAYDPFLPMSQQNPAFGSSNGAMASTLDEDMTQHWGEDENKDRGNWSGRFDFFLSCLGYAVGLGNVWRFPYLCYKSGGGAFLIPYVVMLVFVGVPIFFLELYLGQFTSEGPMTCWKFAPIFSGLGWAMNVISGLVAIYYNVIIAWSLYYLFASFTSELPWSKCDPDWLNIVRGKQYYCADQFPDTKCNATNEYMMDNGMCVADRNMTYDGRISGIYDLSLAKKYGINRQTASELYWDLTFHKTSSGIDEPGELLWYQALCLLLAWIIVFFCMIKGVKSSGKVVYFTAIFPYVVLIILFVKGLTLPGHGDGIKFYLTPDFAKLQDSKVWFAAANQIFFSLSACWGGLIALASYNRFHNNCFRDALLVSISNCLTSFFAGFVIFSFVGYMAHELNVPVDEVAASGPGLAFKVYPLAVTLLPAPPFWSIIFFLMLLTLGLDSQFTLLETVVTSLADVSPEFMRKRKIWVLLFICCLFYLIGLSMCTQGGGYVFTVFDYYSGGWNVLLIGFFELVAVGWVYGVKRVTNDVYIMLGFKPIMPWWGLCWCCLSPILIIYVLLFSWMDYTPATHAGKPLPVWANGIGWFFALISIGGIFAYALFALCMAKGSFWDRLRETTTPAPIWGPSLVRHRRLVNYVQGFVLDPRGELDGYDAKAAMEMKQHTNPGYSE